MNEFQMIGELRRKSIGLWIATFLSMAEAGYTFVIVHRISSLAEPFRAAQALFIALLLDMAILYFTLFAPGKRKQIAKFFLVGMLGNIILAQIPWNSMYVRYTAIVVVACEVVSAIYFFSEITLFQEKVIVKHAAKQSKQAPQAKEAPARPNTPAKPKAAQKPANELEKEIVKLFKSGDGLSFREIARQLDTNHKKVSRTIEKFKLNGHAVAAAVQ